MIDFFMFFMWCIQLMIGFVYLYWFMIKDWYLKDDYLLMFMLMFSWLFTWMSTILFALS